MFDDQCWVQVGVSVGLVSSAISDSNFLRSTISVGSVERWGAGVGTQKNVRGEIGGWGREPFHENYAPSLSTIYDGA